MVQAVATKPDTLDASKVKFIDVDGRPAAANGKVYAAIDPKARDTGLIVIGTDQSDNIEIVRDGNDFIVKGKNGTKIFPGPGCKPAGDDARCDPGKHVLRWVAGFMDDGNDVVKVAEAADTKSKGFPLDITVHVNGGDGDDWGAWVPLMQLLSGRTPGQVDAGFASAAEVIEWIRQRSDWWRGQRFAKVDWFYQSLAYDAHDVGTTPGFDGDTRRALESVALPALVLAPPLDLYNPAEAARWAARSMPGARFIEIPSDWGHQSASPADSVAASFLNETIARFLAGQVS